MSRRVMRAVLLAVAPAVAPLAESAGCLPVAGGAPAPTPGLSPAVAVAVVVASSAGVAPPAVVEPSPTAETAAGAPAVPESLDAELVPGYTRLTPSLAAAGQPTAEALGRLREWGFATVINLRTDAEPGVKDEAALLPPAGVKYVSVPVTPDTFSLADVDAVQRVLDDPASGPVLLHCGSSNRVGAVWAVLQARARGLGADAAVEEGRKAGLRSDSMIAAVRRLLGAPPK